MARQPKKEVVRNEAILSVLCSYWEGKKSKYRKYKLPKKLKNCFGLTEL